MKNLKLPKQLKIDFQELGVKYKKTSMGYHVYHPNFDLEDVILEYLSNTYEFCVNSMSFELLTENDIPTGFKVFNIDWDTTE